MAASMKVSELQRLLIGFRAMRDQYHRMGPIFDKLAQTSEERNFLDGMVRQHDEYVRAIEAVSLPFTIRDLTKNGH
jgi:hypothetical protein